MDDIYQMFKPQTYTRKKHAASLKIAQQVSACRKYSSIVKDTGGGTQSMLPAPSPPLLLRHKSFLTRTAKKVTSDMMNNPQRRIFFWITPLDGDDLSFIVNGNNDDHIKLFTFDFTFTKELIWKAWRNIVFIPTNRKCLKHFKVQQELGVGGADGYINQELGNWQEE